MENYVKLNMNNISKSFPGVQALDNVSFELRKGEVHCLLGENGAGKSTLIKILSGAYQKDQGEIILDGKPVEIRNAHDSRMLGVSTIYQEMSLIPAMTVAENIFLGEEPAKKFASIIKRNEMVIRAKEIFQEMRVDINPDSLVKDLSTAQQQMVEIARSLIKKRDIIIMDEPTSSITDKDTSELFRIIKRLKTQGVSIIYISHRLQELAEIVDRITVLRDGKYVSTVNMKDVTVDHLISMMVGRTLEDMGKPYERESGGKVLEADRLTRGKSVKEVSFYLKKGEILGFAGLVGAGRTEVMRLLFGADKLQSGRIVLNGRPVKITSPKNAVKLGIGYLSEDRKKEGLVLKLGIDKNITLANLSTVSKSFLINMKKEKDVCEEKIKELAVATSSSGKLAGYLSGGNQQKVVIAKWLLTNCDILIFDEPTRGIDVGARAEIYKLMNMLADEGKSIIIVSSDLPEILRISNRIIVMNDGRVTGEVENKGEVTQEEVMSLMLGGIGNAS